jgi:plasmid stabilization system protein ParE
MGRYFLSSVAEADMLAIWEYIAQDNIAAADRVIDRFTVAFERIASFPEAGTEYKHPKG